jgi:hypothetical protein
MVAGYAIPFGPFGLDSPLRYSHMDIDNMEEYVRRPMNFWGKVIEPLLFVAPAIGGFGGRRPNDQFLRKMCQA